ncbi:MAG: hypothetical protein R2699_16340 [Acidimicrobiales bacterium]
MGGLQAAQVPDAEIDKITHTNAMRIFDYDPFSVLRLTSTCQPSRPLRAQATAAGVDTSLVSHGAPPPPDTPIRIIDLAERALGKKSA